MGFFAGWFPGFGTVNVTNLTATGNVQAAVLIGQAALSHTTFTGFMRFSEVTPAAIAANTNDYNPGVAAFQRWSATAPFNVTGLAAGDRASFLIIENIGANAITLTHQDAASAAANRWLCDTGANLVLAAAGGRAMAVYDVGTQRWRVGLI